MPSSLIVGDCNGDGGLDVAVADSGSNTVSMLLGNFDGTLGGERTVAGWNHYYAFGPLDLAAGDFKGDGTLDLVVAFEIGGAGCVPLESCSGVIILLGNGDGTFPQGETYTLPLPPDVGPTAVEVGDFNSDGTQDVAVEVTYLGTTWYLLAGNGDGTFQDAVAVSGPPSGALFVPFVDFNGDGIPDQAILGGYGTISILLGGSSQTLPGPTGRFL